MFAYNLGMNPERRFALEMLATLQDVKKELMIVTKDTSLVYRLKRDDEVKKLGLDKNPDEQYKILRKLEELGAFKIKASRVSKGWEGIFTEDNAPLLSREYEIEINQQRFDELYEIYVRETNSNEPTASSGTGVMDLEVRLVKEGANLHIETPNAKVFLTRLKTGLIPERLFAALIVNYGNGRFVTRAELKKEIEGLVGLNDISEVIRLAGFNKALKRIFFAHCTKNEVELRNPAKVTQNELDTILSLDRAKPN